VFDNPGANGTVVLSELAGKEGFRPQFRFESPEPGFIDIGQDRNGNFVVESNDNIRMLIQEGGNVGIGTTSPSHPLQMASGAHVTSGGVWTDASSREYKENIRALSSAEALAALSELEPSRFNYKADPGEEQVGFIAEDVPALVATKDRKGLSPMDIVAVLAKVVQEQQKTLAQLQEEVNALKRK